MEKRFGAFNGVFIPNSPAKTKYRTHGDSKILFFWWKMTKTHLEKSISEMIYENSQETDLLFMGLAVPAEHREDEYYERLLNMTKGLKTVLLVKGRLV